MLELDTKDKRNKFYHSTDWNQLRMKAYLRDNRECQHCKQEGKVVKGQNVHHTHDHEPYYDNQYIK